MTKRAPPPRRAGWPWPPAAPAAPAAMDALDEARTLVNASAVAVAKLTEALQLALQRLQEAEAEAHVVAACMATREADAAIAKARRSLD